MIRTIETKRLILRKPKMSDLKSFFNYAKKPNIGPSAGWLPHGSIKESKVILKEFIKNKDTWVITIKPNKEMVGTIALTVKSLKEGMRGTCELGYAIDDNYWNKGYMTEAVTAIINEAFDFFEATKIIVGHESNNIASQKIILKHGFRFTHFDNNRVFANKDIKTVYMYELNKVERGETSE